MCPGLVHGEGEDLRDVDRVVRDDLVGLAKGVAVDVRRSGMPPANCCRRFMGVESKDHGRAHREVYKHPSVAAGVAVLFSGKAQPDSTSTLHQIRSDFALFIILSLSFRPQIRFVTSADCSSSLPRSNTSAILGGTPRCQTPWASSSMSMT